MKLSNKPAIASYAFMAPVNDGTGAYEWVQAKYELEWFKGLVSPLNSACSVTLTWTDVVLL
jgi:hypothetical protein